MFAIYSRTDIKLPYQAFEGTVKNVKAAIKRFQKLPVAGAELYSVMDVSPGVKLYALIKAAGLIKTNKNRTRSAVTTTNRICLTRLQCLAGTM